MANDTKCDEQFGDKIYYYQSHFPGDHKRERERERKRGEEREVEGKTEKGLDTAAWQSEPQLHPLTVQKACTHTPVLVEQRHALPCQ